MLPWRNDVPTKHPQSPWRKPGTLPGFPGLRHGLCERVCERICECICERSFFPYPQRVQPPFLALIHQHLRHASILYPLGILCFAVFSLGCLWLFVQPDNAARSALTTEWWRGITGIVCIGGIIIFWGTIFGHDQKNDSYRFLSRLGIHEGNVWWSRMLLPLLLYIPVFVCFAAYVVVDMMGMGLSRYEAGTPAYQRVYEENIRNIFDTLPIFFTIWLAPAALGAFLSISLRSQIVSIVLTLAGAVALFFWGILFWQVFNFSIWWTTLPIVITLLIASRIRAGYWLRENFTWRSRLLPLAPVFATILAILAAVPPVRVYTIPYVSWEQIAAYLDEADLPVRLTPEKRAALLQFMKDGTDSPEYRFRERYENPWGTSLVYPDWDDISDDAQILQRQLLQRQLEYRKQALEDSLSIEELIFTAYFNTGHYLHQLETAQLEKGDPHYQEQRSLALIKRFMPWEMTRWERANRVHLVRALIETGNVQDERAVLVKHWQESRSRWHNDSLLDGFWRGDLSWGGRAETGDFPPLVWQWSSLQCRYHLHIVFAAINCYYWEHDRTLPESLEDLVGLYLDELPVQPLTGEPVEYLVHFEPPVEFFKSKSVGCAYLGLTPFPRVAMYYRQPDATGTLQSWEEERRTDVFITLGSIAFAIFEPEE